MPAGTLSHFVGRFAGETCGGEVELAGEILHAVVGLRYRTRVERVGRDHIGAGVEIFAVDRLDHFWLRDRQQIVVAAQIPVPIRESGAAKIGLEEFTALDHRAHGAVEDDESFPKELTEGGATFARRLCRAGGRSSTGGHQATRVCRRPVCGRRPSA